MTGIAPGGKGPLLFIAAIFLSTSGVSSSQLGSCWTTGLAYLVAAMQAVSAAGAECFLGRFVFFSLLLKIHAVHSSSLSSPVSLGSTSPPSLLCQNSLHLMDLSHCINDASTSVLLNFFGKPQKLGPRLRNLAWAGVISWTLL